MAKRTVRNTADAVRSIDVVRDVHGIPAVDDFAPFGTLAVDHVPAVIVDETVVNVDVLNAGDFVDVIVRPSNPRRKTMSYDGFTKFDCDTCGRRSHHRPHLPRTTCMPCIRERGITDDDNV